MFTGSKFTTLAWPSYDLQLTLEQFAAECEAMGMTVGTSKSKTGWFLNLQSFFHSDINTVDLKSQENAKIIMKCYEKISVLKTAKLYATIYLKMQPVSFFVQQFQTTKNKMTEQFTATEFICATK